MVIPKTNYNSNKIATDINNYNNQSKLSRKSSFQDSKNNIVENYTLLKVDSNRSNLSHQKNYQNDSNVKENSVMNNSKISNSSQTNHNQYLDRRHFESLERLNKLRIEKLKVEDAELTNKPFISKNSQKICEKLAMKSHTGTSDRVKSDNYSKNIDNTINNMKKELYDTDNSAKNKKEFNEKYDKTEINLNNKPFINRNDYMYNLNNGNMNNKLEYNYDIVKNRENSFSNNSQLCENKNNSAR